MKTKKFLVFAAALFLLNLAACDSTEMNPVTPSADAARANREDSAGTMHPDSIPSFPADSIPTDSIPTESIPIDSIPTDSIPTDSTPTDSIPTNSIPLDPVRNNSIATDSLKK